MPTSLANGRRSPKSHYHVRSRKPPVIMMRQRWPRASLANAEYRSQGESSVRQPSSRQNRGTSHGTCERSWGAMFQMHRFSTMGEMWKCGNVGMWERRAEAGLASPQSSSHRQPELKRTVSSTQTAVAPGSRPARPSVGYLGLPLDVGSPPQADAQRCYSRSSHTPDSRRHHRTLAGRRR